MVSTSRQFGSAKTAAGAAAITTAATIESVLILLLRRCTVVATPTTTPYVTLVDGGRRLVRCHTAIVGVRVSVRVGHGVSRFENRRDSLIIYKACIRHTQGHVQCYARRR